MKNKNDIQLSSVKLVAGGLKGIEVKYQLSEVRENRYFFNEYSSKKKAPVHRELEECFSWLKGHLLDICGYSLDEAERKYHMDNLEMTSVTLNDKGFILSGQLNILNGDKALNITTPIIAETDEYCDNSKVVAIIEGIFAETKEYMAGKKQMDDVQFVIKSNKENEEFDKDAFMKLTKKEQREFATKILEDQGAFIFLADEMEGDATPAPTKEKAPAKEVAKVAPIKAEPIAVVEEKPAPTPEVDPFADDIVAEEKDPFADDEDDFVLPVKVAEPIKASTAKRK